MIQQPQPAAVPGAAPPPVAGMAPQAAPPPTGAQTKQVVQEGLNIAAQAGLEAAEAAAQDQTIPQETVTKIAEGTTLLAEAAQELEAPAAPAAGAMPPSTEEGTEG